MDVLCSTAMRTRVDTGKKRVFHAFSWPAAARRASCLTRKLPWPSSSCVGLRELSPQVGLLKNEWQSRRQERFPGEVSVFSGAVSLRPVCRFTREAAVAILPAGMRVPQRRSGLSDDVPRARRVRSALSGVAGTDHARPHLQGRVPATARGATLRPWRWRGRGGCCWEVCWVIHDYEKNSYR